MAKAKRINGVKVVVVPGERGFDSKLVDPAVTAMYVKMEHDKAPLSKAEADERGLKGFNGLMSSFVTMEIIDGDVLEVGLMATRYLLGQAVRDIAKEFGDEAASEVSVSMANVSLLVPTLCKGEPMLIAQVKGKALGSGQIHAAMTAGNVKAKYLANDGNPLLKTLQAETTEEIGLDLSLLNPSDACILIDESETGQVNIGAVAKGVKLEAVVNAYLQSIANKPLEKLEVMGLALIPIRDAGSIKDGIAIFEPDGNGGGAWKFEERGLRPYTEAIIDWLADPNNQDFLIEKAGL